MEDSLLENKTIDRQYLLSILSEEKENYSNYVGLCEKYKIQPNPIVTAVSTAKQDLLRRLMDGKSNSTLLLENQKITT